LLVQVAFLIGFFWLLFAIIGVQAFKASLSRQCVWIDPQNISNYTNNFTLCGGYQDNTTGESLPWVFSNGTIGQASPKGFICPRGSQCIEQISLYNGTVNFDNIANSLELVFVTMTANTFTDLMYYTTNSDYLPAALFFAAAIVIMMLWLTNLLIAVITSSFAIIREENKGSAFKAAEQPALPLEHNAAIRKRMSVLKYWYDKTAWIWIIVISYGLLCQALRTSSISPSQESFISYSEVIVTMALFVEIILRFAADWRNFHRRRRNLVDATLAVITMVILFPPIRNSGQPYAWLTIFQILRIYRVVWAVPMTRDLIGKVLGDAIGIGNLVLFVFLITFLVSIFAVQLFRGDIPTVDQFGNTVEITFFSVYNAFLGMYQILSSENWTILLYNVAGYNHPLHTGWIGAIFLIGWFILSYFILINMFIAVIQENFDVSEDEKRLQQVKAFLQNREMGSSSSNLALSTIFRLGRSRKAKDPLDYGQAAMEMLLKDAVVRDFLDEETDPRQQNSSVEPLTMGNASTAQQSGSGLSALWDKFLARVWNREPNPFYSNLRFTGAKETLDPRVMAKEAVSASIQRKKAQRDFLARHPMYNTTLFIFKPTNPIRRFCQRIVGPGRGSERFDGVEPNRVVWHTFSALIYATIVTMVVLACVTTPLYQKEYFETHVYSVTNWFVWTDLAFAAIFSVEAMIKVIADGCFWTPNAYFRSLWGFIDGLVLITLLINVITSFLSYGVVSRAIGAFKALRALRLLNVSDSARDTFNKLIFVGGWRVLSAAVVSMFLLVPFAIYGVNLFNGKFAICNDNTPDIFNLSDCAGEWGGTPFNNNWTMVTPRVVSNPYYNFDSFGGALFVLYQIVSQEGWVDVMWSAESIMGRGLQRQNYASQGNAVFFVIFNLMATVFVLTLFISVFMRTYTEQTGVAFLTTEQRSWMEMRKLLRQVAPSKRPSNKVSPKWKIWCYKRAVQKHGIWHKSVTVILVLHIFLLMLEYYPEPYWWTRLRDCIFLGFTVFYIANIFVRIIGLSWARFRRSSWDVYSLLAVSGTLVTTLLLFSNFNSQSYMQSHKLFLVSITLLLIPRNSALDQLFKTAAASLTNIVNLLATWFVLFLVYGIAMTQIFGLTRFGSQETNNLNLRTVPKALILLFRMSCGEGWNQIMEDYATITVPFCVDTGDIFGTDCGSPGGARFLFVSWNIISMYIFVSLFVSLIFENFSYVYQRSSGLSIINREETRRFKQAWATFDPQGTGYISKENFPRLLGELSGVFAMRIYDEDDSVRRILEDVQVQTPGMRANSVASASQATGIDLKALNERISRIDAKKVRERRRIYNLFYLEAMVSADPDRGLAFTTVLMILAHYKVISDSKSLK
jgi:voltage-dependent calcium channel